MTRRGCLRDDRRALATGIILFFGVLTLVAVLYALLNPVFTGAEASLSNQTTSPQAQDIIDSRMKVWDNLLLYFIFLAGMALLARAVFESRGGT